MQRGAMHDKAETQSMRPVFRWASNGSLPSSSTDIHRTKRKNTTAPPTRTNRMVRIGFSRTYSSATLIFALKYC